MAEVEGPGNGTPLFRELRGDYEANVGQVVNLREYLDYFEPLGSALSRLPDGVGGPFVYHFSGSGQRITGAVGWVVSAASKRYGGWKLWGMWTEGPIPPLTLPLYWPYLSDPGQSGELLRRANHDAGLLQRREAAGELLDDVDATPLHDDELRTALKVQLSRLYRAPYPHERPLEVEVTRDTLDLLPWLYLLGPVEPGVAQLQPSRFNGAGYQYLFTDSPANDVEITRDVERIVDTTANDVVEGWNMAAALRVQRARPKAVKAASRPPRPAATRPTETNEMRETRSPARREKPAIVPARPADLSSIWRFVRDLVVIALLAWIGWNVHQMRKAAPVPPDNTPAQTVTEADLPEITETRAPDPPPQSRTQRLALALIATPPQGIRLDREALDVIARDGAGSTAALSRAAVEVFLRRNGCHTRNELVDGKLSAGEQRSIRRCTAVTTQRLMKNATEPDVERAFDWLERTLTAAR